MPDRKKVTDSSTRRLLQWYRSLHSRFVDLVGDYTGDETFILEGDSLLLYAFSEPHLDFDQGIQLLHAVYLVEQLLEGLRRRHCNFVIVFFHCHRHLCVPHHVGSEEGQADKYLMAREVIIKHLQANIAPEQVVIHHFQSYQADDFEKFVQECGAYFLMCHDGSRPDMTMASISAPGNLIEDTPRETQASESDSDSESCSDSSSDSGSGSDLDRDGEDAGQSNCHKAHDVCFCSMIFWLTSRSYNVVLLNGIEFQDSRVMATALEHPSATDTSMTELSGKLSTLNLGGMADTVRDEEDFVWAEPASLINKSDYCSQRQILTVCTLTEMYEEDDFDTDNEQDLIYVKALVIHCALLASVPLAERAVDLPEGHHDTQGEVQTILKVTCHTACKVLRSGFWEEHVASNEESDCDLADFIDGRYLFSILSRLQQGDKIVLDPKASKALDGLVTMLEEIGGIALSIASNVQQKSISAGKASGLVSGKTSQSNVTTRSGSVLPFSNPVFDTHLAPVRVRVTTAARRHEETSSSAARIFQEVSYFATHKKHVDPQKLPAAPPTLRHQKAYQRQMAEVRDYAASLTNTSGGILKPETIIETGPGEKPQKASGKPQNDTTAATQSQGKGAGSRKGGRGAAIEAAGAVAKQKQNKAIDAALNGWANIHGTAGKGAVKTVNPVVEYSAAEKYMTGLSDEKREIVKPDVLCYMLQALYTIWKRNITETNKTPLVRPFHIAALSWYTIDKIRKLKTGITSDIDACVQDTIRVLGLPSVQLVVDGQRPLSVTFPGIAYKGGPSKELRIGLSHHEFQLIHMGPYLDKSMGSEPDARVPTFQPDEWQRRVLDQIDKKKSLLVVAPTSAGKTFISFYAMRQVLLSDSNGVLVYVAPTKALVNQIAAEVQARFSKQFKHGGKSVWAIHTRDYRINNPTGCQVLVTVPHILQIMLMAPSNANSWSKRVKRIVFDEVHCIGQAEDGLVWEQLLLMAPCPVIALSATVRNPEAFANWLAATRKGKAVVSSASGNSSRGGGGQESDELVMVEHPHRYSDLRKFVYTPPKAFLFRGVQRAKPSLQLGLDGCSGLAFMHPYASLSNTSRGIPSDLALEPRDCWTLWQSMNKHQTTAYPLSPSLGPDSALPETVRKLDVSSWQEKLDHVLTAWMDDPKSPFRSVLSDLSEGLEHQERPALQVSEGPDTKSHKEGTHDLAKDVNKDSLEGTTLPLICSLHDRNALPVLFFNYDRYGCEEIAKSLLEQLKEAEDDYKESSTEWAGKMTRFKAWKSQAEAGAKKDKKAPVAKASKKQKGNDDENNMANEPGQEDEEAGRWASFDPEDPIDGFHFAGNTMAVSRLDFDYHRERLQWRGVTGWLVDALRRGIGVHHSGMNRKYRTVCEILFRSGYLRVVVSTGTLALGINMPCKTVVFSGDSIFLSALNFRQAAGRAGRRGFDLLGNVVFQQIPYPRVCRLLTSRLPELRGHFPITTSLVLRMCTLLHGSSNCAYARQAVSSLLSVPRIYIDGAEDSKSTVVHHLRFSIEYLRRHHLLSAAGEPLNFAWLVGHLYYQENSAFAFHALLKEGYFHRLSADIRGATESKKAEVLKTLMLVMAHLFARKKLTPAHLERWRQKCAKKTGSSSPSIVVLPALPTEAKAILKKHNDDTRDIFANYARTFADQHLKDEPDNKLPFSSKRFGGDGQQGIMSPPVVPNTRPPTNITSSFVALSGHGDKWDTIGDLCKSVRSGIWLEQEVVPHVTVEEQDELNAYLYDFYSHGDMTALEDANGIHKSDVWYFLNDLSMVLATIVTGFNNFLGVNPEGSDDVDMINVRGYGDEEEDVDTYDGGMDFVAHQAEGSGVISGAKSSTKTKRIVVAEDEEDEDVPESWDDGSDEESDDDDGTETDTGRRDETEGAEGTKGDIMDVLVAFRLLQAEFNDKFKAIWA